MMSFKMENIENDIGGNSSKKELASGEIPTEGTALIGKNVLSYDKNTIDKHFGKQEFFAAAMERSSNLLTDIINNKQTRGYVPTDIGNILISREGDTLKFSLGDEEVILHIAPVGVYSSSAYREGINAIGIGTSINLYSTGGDPIDTGNFAISSNGKLLLFDKIEADYGFSSGTGSSHAVIPMSPRVIEGDTEGLKGTLAAICTPNDLVNARYVVSTTKYSFDKIRDIGTAWASIHGGSAHKNDLQNAPGYTTNRVVHVGGGFCYCKTGFGARSALFHSALVKGVNDLGRGIRFDASFNTHNHVSRTAILDFVQQMTFNSEDITLRLEKSSQTDLSTLLSDYATPKLTYLALKQVYDTLKEDPKYHCSAEGRLYVKNISIGRDTAPDCNKLTVSFFSGLSGDTETRGGIVFPGHIPLIVEGPVSHYSSDTATHSLVVKEKDLYIGEYKNMSKRGSYNEDRPVFTVKMRDNAPHPMCQVIAIKNVQSTEDSEAFGIGPLYIVLPTQSYDIEIADGISLEIEKMGVTTVGSHALSTVKSPEDFSVLHGVRAFVFENLFIHQKRDLYGERGMIFRSDRSSSSKKSNRVCSITRELKEGATSRQVTRASSTDSSVPTDLTVPSIPPPSIRFISDVFDNKEAVLKWLDKNRNLIESKVDRFVFKIKDGNQERRLVLSKFVTRDLFRPGAKTIHFVDDFMLNNFDPFLLLENQILPSGVISLKLNFENFEDISVAVHPSRKIVYINNKDGYDIPMAVKRSLGQYLYSEYDLVLIGLRPVSSKYTVLRIGQPDLRPFVLGGPFSAMGYRDYIQQFAVDNPALVHRFRNHTFVDTTCFDTLPVNQGVLTKNEVSVLLDHRVSGASPLNGFDEKMFYDTINENHQFNIQCFDKPVDPELVKQSGITTILIGDYEVHPELPHAT